MRMILVHVYSFKMASTIRVLKGGVTLVDLQRRFAMRRCCAKNRSSVTPRCERFFCDICSAATRCKFLKAIQKQHCANLEQIGQCNMLPSILSQRWSESLFTSAPPAPKAGLSKPGDQSLRQKLTKCNISANSCEKHALRIGVANLRWKSTSVTPPSCYEIAKLLATRTWLRVSYDENVLCSCGEAQQVFRSVWVDALPYRRPHAMNLHKLRSGPFPLRLLTWFSRGHDRFLVANPALMRPQNWRNSGW